MNHLVLETGVFCIVRDESKGDIFAPLLSEMVRNRYKFVDHPRSSDDYMAGKGLSFAYGVFEEFIIDKMTVFNDGIFVTAKVDSDRLDGLVADFFKAIASEFGVRLDMGKAVSMYNSKIEVELGHGIAEWFEKIQPVAEQLADFARDKDIDVARYEFAGFSMIGEGEGDIKPGRFFFERRVDRRFDECIFFSEAPLSTSNHVKLIQSLERLF